MAGNQGQGVADERHLTQQPIRVRRASGSGDVGQECAEVEQSPGRGQQTGETDGRRRGNRHHGGQIGPPLLQRPAIGIPLNTPAPRPQDIPALPPVEPEEAQPITFHGNDGQETAEQQAAQADTGEQRANQLQLPHIYGSVKSRNWHYFWKVGRIISAPHHVPDWDTRNLIPNSNRCLSSLGTWVYSKVRKLIVIQSHHFSCVTLPIYTYSGNGLSQKPRPFACEHIGIRDEADSQVNKEATEVPDCPNIIARRDGRWVNVPNNDFHFMKPTSYVLLTGPVTFKYDVPCKNEGEIASEAEFRRLLELYNRDRSVQVAPDITSTQDFPALGAQV